MELSCPHLIWLWSSLNGFNRPLGAAPLNTSEQQFSSKALTAGSWLQHEHTSTPPHKAVSAVLARDAFGSTMLQLGKTGPQTVIILASFWILRDSHPVLISFMFVHYHFINGTVRSLSKKTASELIVFPWRAQSHQEPPESPHWHTQRRFVIRSILGADGGIPLYTSINTSKAKMFINMK